MHSSALGLASWIGGKTLACHRSKISFSTVLRISQKMDSDLLNADKAAANPPYLFQLRATVTLVDDKKMRYKNGATIRR